MRTIIKFAQQIYTVMEQLGVLFNLASRFEIKHLEPYTREDFVVVAERVLTRENTNHDIARLIGTTVAERSLDIRDVVKFRRAMQAQTLEEVTHVERLLGQRRMSVFGKPNEN